MNIDRNQLNNQQKVIYDNWLKIPGHTSEDSTLIDLIGFIKQPKTRIRHAQFEQHEKVRREAELVLLHLERGAVPEIKFCKNCKAKFVSNYKYDHHCGDDCLKESLAKLGLKWNPEKTPAERWQTVQVPSTISPTALAVLLPVFEANAAKVAVVLPEMDNLDDPFADF